MMRPKRQRRMMIDKIRMIMMILFLPKIIIWVMRGGEVKEM